MVLAWEEWLPFQHFGKDTSCTPDVHLNIVFLPCEHDLGRPVVPGRHISSHLRVLYTCQAEVANFEIAILVDEDVRRLEVTVDHARRMYVFEATLSSSVHRNRSSMLADLLGFGRGSTE